MEHRLNVLPESSSIKQKKQHFYPKKGRVIKAEIIKLLEEPYLGGTILDLFSKCGVGSKGSKQIDVRTLRARRGE